MLEAIADLWVYLGLWVGLMVMVLIALWGFIVFVDYASRDIASKGKLGGKAALIIALGFAFIIGSCVWAWAARS